MTRCKRRKEIQRKKNYPPPLNQNHPSPPPTLLFWDQVNTNAPSKDLQLPDSIDLGAFHTVEEKADHVLATCRRYMAAPTNVLEDLDELYSYQECTDTFFMLHCSVSPWDSRGEALVAAESAFIRKFGSTRPKKRTGA